MFLNRNPSHCGQEILFSERYELENLNKSERVFETIEPDGSSFYQLVSKLRVLIGYCPICRETCVATEGVNARDQVITDLRFIKGRRKKGHIIGRVTKEHPKYSQDRMSWVWGTSTDGTLRAVRKTVMK